MARVSDKVRRLGRRKRRVRKKIAGTAGCPRLAVTRSASHIYAQIIDDGAGRTLVSSSSVALKIPGGNIEAAKKVGEALATNAEEASIEQVRFDRRGRLFHGRIKALADAARGAGLKF